MKLKVLIVEDDEVVTFLHKKIVQKEALSDAPLNFLDGIYCFEYLEKNYEKDVLYLILLDINMPQMNAWHFLDKVQEMPFVDQLAVVLVTSSIDSIDREKAVQYSQVIDYIEKPLNLDICSRIKKLPQVAPFFS